MHAPSCTAQPFRPDGIGGGLLEHSRELPPRPSGGVSRSAALEELKQEAEARIDLAETRSLLMRTKLS